MIEENEIKRGGWVRLPREMGYAEGQKIEPVGVPLTIFGEPTTGVYFPQKGEAILCPVSWLTPIDEPSNYPDDPKWNPVPEGHPMVDRNRAEVGLVTAYVRSIERGNTEDSCWCPWTPLEVQGKMGRLRAGEHPQCPVHTKEGFLFGFIDYVRERFTAEAVQKLIEGKGEGTIKGFLNPDPDAVCPACNEPHDPPYSFACTKPVETMETKEAGARFL